MNFDEKITEISKMGKVGAEQSLSMPHTTARTTTQKEIQKKRPIFMSKIFYISSDDEAAIFAETINWIMEPEAGRQLVSEQTTWTQAGELIRVIDFLMAYNDKYLVRREPKVGKKNTVPPVPSSKVTVVEGGGETEREIGIIEG